MMSTNNENDAVSIVIAGGGPAGLLSAILFGKMGIPVTVIERSAEPDPWSSRSYSLVLGKKGMAALEKAGCLTQARQAGMVRECVIMHDASGNVKIIPKQHGDSLGFSRPILVECLEKVAKEEECNSVEIKRGVGVSSVEEKDGMMQVTLQDGSVLSCTHVIGADGKWSKVRESFSSFQTKICTEPSFGLHIMVDAVPEGWRNDGTHVIQPSDECMFYIIAAPIPTGELSISMVCYDDTVKRYPWLAPPSNDSGNVSHGWEGEYSARPKQAGQDTDLADKLADLFATELPWFLQAIGREALSTARINKRVSWVDLQSSSFATSNGRVALIGDAAHAVVPTLGEGCNMALESAVRLVDSLETEKGVTPTAAELSQAFVAYGEARPKEVQSIQIKSAERSRRTGV